jgi:pantetheine-phosphate adenylyltransferase
LYVKKHFNYIQKNKKVKRISVFPGSFDPFTIGHQSILEKALPLFDEIYIGIGINAIKKSYFPLEQRIEWIKEIYKNESKIKIETYEGLTISFCKEVSATYLLRGLRNTIDFEYEKTIAQMNYNISNIETVFFITSPEFSTISSTSIRDILHHGGDVSNFLPKEIKL